MSHAKLTLEMRVVAYPEPNSGFEPQTLASVVQTVDVEFDGNAPSKFGDNVNAKISECRPAFTHLLAYLESFFSGRKPFPPEKTVSLGEAQFRSLVNMVDAGKLLVPRMQITPEDEKGVRDVIITVKHKK